MNVARVASLFSAHNGALSYNVFTEVNMKGNDMRSAFFGFLGAGVFALIFGGGPVVAQNVKDFIVKLQDTTPGTAQTGHSNITGTMRAGAGVVSSAVSGGPVLSASNSATDNGSIALRGEASGTSGNNIGIYGKSASNQGTAIFGDATNGVGGGIGVFGQSAAAVGRGIWGLCTNNVGLTTGVHGEVRSDGGKGVVALATAGSGPTYGVHATSNSTTGIGVFGLGASSSGQNIGVRGETNSTTGTGVYGKANGANGSGIAGLFEAFGLGGRGIVSNCLHPSGLEAAIEALAVSSSSLCLDCTGDVLVNGDLTVTGSKTGYVADIVINGGNEPLETGDVVEIMGNERPVIGDIPVIVVRKARGGEGVLGPIDCALALRQVKERETDGKLPARLRYESPQFVAHKIDGPIAPGEYGRVVTLGSFKTIRVDASFGAISAGDLLVSSSNPGFAMRRQPTKVDHSGSIVGKALGGLKRGSGTVPVFVLAR